MTEHETPDACRGERCDICYRVGGESGPAKHKVEEAELPVAYLSPRPHPSPATYVCCYHFRFIMGGQASCEIPKRIEP